MLLESTWKIEGFSCHRHSNIGARSPLNPLNWNRFTKRMRPKTATAEEINLTRHRKREKHNNHKSPKRAESITMADVRKILSWRWPASRIHVTTMPKMARERIMKRGHQRIGFWIRCNIKIPFFFMKRGIIFDFDGWCYVVNYNNFFSEICQLKIYRCIAGDVGYKL